MYIELQLDGDGNIRKYSGMEALSLMLDGCTIAVVSKYGEKTYRLYRIDEYGYPQVSGGTSIGEVWDTTIEGVNTIVNPKLTFALAIGV